ncbi:MAG: hypothetical protein LBP60_04510 [Spirochaetaceae bacterium]|jgi:hypothetical protein|nr:hypothetical protein [Spirochaetaceae bacterium]
MRSFPVFPVLALLFLGAAYTAAQENDFGFEEFSQELGTPGGPVFPSLKLGGEISAELDFFTGDTPSANRLGDIFSGKINFTASSAVAEAVINLKLRSEFRYASPVSIDEAYGRFFFGPLDLEAGLRKLSWGRADSFGPLDVINPLDYTNLSAIDSPRTIKIARPMIHVSWNIDSFSKLEGVFVPWFQGHKYALEGRWTPAQLVRIKTMMAAYFPAIKDLYGWSEADYTTLESDMAEKFASGIIDGDPLSLAYAQGGLRFTTTAGSLDLGFQYYFGRLPRIAIANIRMGPLGPIPSLQDVRNMASIDYNYYHQIGLDFAWVMGGFNFRAEGGANITGDLTGDRGDVYNPALVWSLGFDRDLFWGLNLNLQGNGSVILMHHKISSVPLADTEGGTHLSSTRITAIISRRFFLDQLETKLTALWGIEDQDFLIIPALVWTKNDVGVELSGGFFGGNREGELGWYGDNGYVKIVLGWKF